MPDQGSVSRPAERERLPLSALPRPQVAPVRPNRRYVNTDPIRLELRIRRSPTSTADINGTGQWCTRAPLSGHNSGWPRRQGWPLIELQRVSSRPGLPLSVSL